MKPETKFKKQVAALAKSYGMVVKSVDDYMSGMDSRTRKAWRSFSLKLDQSWPPSQAFLNELEAMNAQSYIGTNVATGLQFNVDLAVRYISTTVQRFAFAGGVMTQLS